MRKMTTLFADEGMILTNGENYGTTVSLAEGETGDNYTEITKEEYDELMKAQEETPGF